MHGIFTHLHESPRYGVKGGENNASERHERGGVKASKAPKGFPSTAHVVGILQLSQWGVNKRMNEGYAGHEQCNF